MGTYLQFKCNFMMMFFWKGASSRISPYWSHLAVKISNFFVAVLFQENTHSTLPEKIVKVCLHSCKAMQNSFQFDDFFLPKKFKILISRILRIYDFFKKFFHPKLAGTLGISCSKYFFFSEPCNYLDSLVNYHLTSLPNQIFEAKKVAKKKLGFQVGKSHTQGFSLLTGMVFDITWEFWIIMSFFSVAFVMHQCTNLAKFCLQRLRLHGVWKSKKKSHSTLRAKRAKFTFWVDKSELKKYKMPKMV